MGNKALKRAFSDMEGSPGKCRVRGEKGVIRAKLHLYINLCG